MTFTLFIALVMAFSVVTSYTTEGVKKVLDGLYISYASNMAVLIVSAVVGIAGTSVAYVLLGIPFTAENIICIVLMTIAVWLSAMLGYDKVLQMIEQFRKLG
ncbi:MAG: hypothetical protein ACI3XA_04600 [Clostridia bacterium]